MERLLVSWILILHNALYLHVESANPCAKTSPGTVLDDPLYPQCGFLLCVYNFPYVYRCAPGTYWNSQSKQCLLDTHKLCYDMDPEVGVSNFMDRVPTSLYKEPPASSKQAHIVDYSPGDRISLTNIEDSNTQGMRSVNYQGNVDANRDKQEASDVVYLGHDGIFVNKNDPILNQDQKDDEGVVQEVVRDDLNEKRKYTGNSQNNIFGVKDVIKRLYKKVSLPKQTKEKTYPMENDAKENVETENQAPEVSEYRAVDGDIVWHIVPNQNTFFGKRDPTFKYQVSLMEDQLEDNGEDAIMKNKNGRISKHRVSEESENILEDPSNTQMWQIQSNQAWQSPSNQVWQSGQTSQQTMMNPPTNQVWQQPSNQVWQQQPSNQVWQQQPTNQVWQQQPSNQVWQQQPSNQVWQQQPTNQVWQQQPSNQVWQQQPSNQVWQQQPSNQVWQQASDQAWQTQGSSQQLQTQVIQCSQPNDIGKLFPDATNRCRFLNCEWPHLQKITIMNCAPGTAYDDTTKSCDIHDPGC